MIDDPMYEDRLAVGDVLVDDAYLDRMELIEAEQAWGRTGERHSQTPAEQAWGRR